MNIVLITGTKNYITLNFRKLIIFNLEVINLFQLRRLYGME
jgi:hypothetical protein